MPKFEKPSPIYVFVTVSPTAKNGISKPFTSRIGACKTENEIAPMIAEDRKAMNDTFSGLIAAPGTSGREYRAFRAEWTELKL